MPGYIYILTNKPYGTLYIGVTSNLAQRMYTHKYKAPKSSFSARYKLHKLVFYETFEHMHEALTNKKKQPLLD